MVDSKGLSSTDRSPVTSAKSQGLLSEFISDLNGGTGCPFNKGRVAGAAEGCAAIQKDLDRLEKWTDRTDRTLRKGHFTATTGWLTGKQLCRRGLGILVDTKLIIGKQCTFAAERPITSWAALGRV